MQRRMQWTSHLLLVPLRFAWSVAEQPLREAKISPRETDAIRQTAPRIREQRYKTYLDAWHAGGRGQEAAEAILERQLRPQWKLRSGEAYDFKNAARSSFHPTLVISSTSIQLAIQRQLRPSRIARSRNPNISPHRRRTNENPIRRLSECSSYARRLSP